MGPGGFSGDFRSPAPFPDGGLPFGGLQLGAGKRVAIRRRVGDRGPDPTPFRGPEGPQVDSGILV